MNRRTTPAVLGTAALLLASCSGGEGSDASNLRVSHPLAEDHPAQTCGIDTMAEILDEGDSGLVLESFPAGQLGTSAETIDNLIAGNVELAIPSFGELAVHDEQLSLLDANYLFDDYDHLYEVMNGSIGEDLVAGLRDDTGVRVLDVWYMGTRQLTSNDRVTRPEDLSGLKIRAIDSPVGIANVRALGADPVPVAFTELYTALSQGVVDGQENPLAIMASASVQEVQSWIHLTNHQMFAVPMAVNEQAWQALTEEQQEALLSAAQDVGPQVRECTEQAETELMDEWEESGQVQVNSDVDVDAFRARAEEEIPAQFEDLWGDLYREIRAAR